MLRIAAIAALLAAPAAADQISRESCLTVLSSMDHEAKRTAAHINLQIFEMSIIADRRGDTFRAIEGQMIDARDKFLAEWAAAADAFSAECRDSF